MAQCGKPRRQLLDERAPHVGEGFSQFGMGHERAVREVAGEQSAAP
jgi:hypothetical protein